MLANKLDQVDIYLQQQAELREVLRKGFMHLAEAKYILGPAVISSDSYDRRMQATRFWSDSSSEDQGDDCELEDTNKAKAKQTEAITVSTLRQRKGITQVVQRNGADNDSAKPNEELEVDHSKEKDRKAKERAKRLRDPLYMFTALPPKSLRDAQDCFKRVVSLLENFREPLEQLSKES
ncbi:hypothetical protein HK100_003839 [Physocladia obscura]|uniref:Vacuolar ATPase assembly protein VMA22 n=1 Tax=Physocladia obscura TaxID=109957 RepID=A0AAD5T7K7_9FUNG|nr:hypothetical protein HK100_003839 [Physocladia obscura]